jgi:hypothetical protein
MYKYICSITMAIALLFANATFAQKKMKYQKAKNVDFYNKEVYESILNRLESTSPNAERKWGKMDVAQMLHHLNLAIGSGLG